MKNLAAPTKVAYKTKKEYVFAILREAIMEGQLLPDQKLVIRSIANRLEVSTIPVREALQQLHAEDLIEYNPHMGAIVSRITKASIVETFTIKEGLETSVARTVCEVMRDADQVKLAELLQRMDQAIEMEDDAKWGVLNDRFHHLIIEIASMPLMKEMHERVMDKWRRIQRYFFNEVFINRNVQSQKEHYAIFHALKQSESEQAELLIKQHNRNALQDYMLHLREKERPDI